ncbi:threonine synthase [Candidatus Woesearchaeota archaeon]|nr:threonine synthase [Candidatus Woesearchaeota archaeon]
MTLAQAIRCVRCKKTFSPQSIIFECDACKGPLDVVYDYAKIRRNIITDDFKRAYVSHWKYWPFYPVADLQSIVTLHEGGTPLIPSNSVRGYLFKNEGVNPTGSFKDRGTTVEVTKAKELGVTQVACASTGNMGASVAAYCARARIKSTIFLPTFASKIKRQQISAFDSQIVPVRGTYEDAVAKTKKLREQKHVYLMGDYAYRGEGEKSVGFEIIDQLNWNIPDYVVMPVGNATLFSAVYKALYELHEVSLIKRIPRLVGVEAKGCNPLVVAYHEGATDIEPVKHPRTIASAINCGNPVDAVKALYALRHSHGIMCDVTDKEMLAAKKELTKEGLWVEPSAAASYAGAKKLGLSGDVVCVLTGHGLKDPTM